MEGQLNLIVKWNNAEYVLEGLLETDNVEALKNVIFKKTGVRPERQKLLNVKFNGKMPTDDCLISNLNVKEGFKIMMMGSLETAIADANTIPDDLPSVINDFDIEEGEEVPIENKEVYLAKIHKRVSDYEVKMLNPARPGMKLLVLDIDYTLFDHKSVAESGYELMRPFLHEFLTSAYRHYDIVIWSATSMKWIEEKMKLLGVSSHPDYKITFYLDYLAMISVHTPKYGVIQVKPLGVIWGKFPHYSPDNTIMFDDIRRNFLMNPQNGLRIRAFRQAHTHRQTDRELLKLAKYLEAIAGLDSFAHLEHRHWERYLTNRRKEKKKRRGDGGETSSSQGNSP
uniref:Ubiquitin-like domain-containing CTD phosphatase 1 n=1 Tax=Lygus hesperus TaxID=30085 RepID=A0A0A9X4J1_LYGHE